MAKIIKRKPAEVVREDINGIKPEEYTDPKNPKYIPASQRPNDPITINAPSFWNMPWEKDPKTGKSYPKGYEYAGFEDTSSGQVPYVRKKAVTQAPIIKKEDSSPAPPPQSGNLEDIFARLLKEVKAHPAPKNQKMFERKK